MSIKTKIRQSVLDSLLKILVPAPVEGDGQRRPFGPEEFRLIREALLSQNLCSTDGQMVANFEKEFAALYDAPYAVASTSGTAAIHVALGALDLNPCDEVITAPITDLGTIIPILSQNAIPVFADIDDTYNMDPADVERKITPRTRAIIVVHLFGNTCNMDAMSDIARRHKIPLIEDCAQAHLAEYKGKYAGTIGDIGCFSFQQSKHMTTGDGGMTVTGNKTYYERMKLFADKGYARKGWGSRAYLFHAPNYRMNELVGAVGLAQLKKLQGIVSKRQELGQYMTELLKGVDGVRVAPVTPGAKHTYWLYPMALTGVDTALFAAELRKSDIHVGLGYTGKPIYLCSESLTAKKTYGDSQFPFSASGKSYEYKEGLCPRAEKTLESLICVPLNEAMSRSQIERNAGLIASAIKKLAKPAEKTKSAGAPLTAGLPAAVSASMVSAATVAPQKAGKTTAIGIIGCGQMGRWHLNSYKQNPSCKVVGLVDTDFSRAQVMANEIGARAYRSHTEMIANEALQGVSVCTLPSTHREIVLDLLRSGIHVLCEKPLAISVDEGREMLQTAQDHRALVLPAFKFRFFDEVQKAKELIDRNSLGKILTFRVMFGGLIDMTGTWYAQKKLAGGGVIMDNGPHALDIVRYLLGEVRSVNAYGSHFQKLEVEDTAQLSLSLESGAMGTADLSWSSSMPSSNYLEIYGEDGNIFLSAEGLNYKFKTWKEWKSIPRERGPRELFALQIDHFLQCVGGMAPKQVTNEDGLKAQILIEAAYESIRSDSKVAVSNGERVPEPSTAA